MKYMYLLFTLSKGYTIEKWEIIKEEYSGGWKYYLSRPKESLLTEVYNEIIVDDKYITYNESIIAAFSPKCALLKHIMNLNNNIIELGEKLGNNYVEIIYSQIHQAKKELEKYL